MSIEAILQDFGSIMLSDSDSTWNGVDSVWQKCLGHYNRNIEGTLKTNKSNEFQIFTHELQLIIKRAIRLYKQADGKAVPEKLVDNLQKRINCLTRRTYDDKDCKVCQAPQTRGIPPLDVSNTRHRIPQQHV